MPSYEDFMPFGLINQLICHFGQLPDRKKFWRDQLLFTIFKKDGEKTIHQAKILINLNFNDLKLEVYAHFDKTCDNDGFKDLVKEYIFYSIMSFDDPYFNLPSFELYKSSITDINCYVNENYIEDEKKTKYTISFCIIDSVFEELYVFNKLHDKHLHINDDNILISLDKKTFIRYSELLENNNKPTISTYHEDLQFYREMPAYQYKAFSPS